LKGTLSPTPSPINVRGEPIRVIGLTDSADQPLASMGKGLGRGKANKDSFEVNDE
jgi:hypothetical protein